MTEKELAIELKSILRYTKKEDKEYDLDATMIKLILLFNEFYGSGIHFYHDIY